MFLSSLFASLPSEVCSISHGKSWHNWTQLKCTDESVVEVIDSWSFCDNDCCLALYPLFQMKRFALYFRSVYAECYQLDALFFSAWICLLSSNTDECLCEFCSLCGVSEASPAAPRYLLLIWSKWQLNVELWLTLLPLNEVAQSCLTSSSSSSSSPSSAPLAQHNPLLTSFPSQRLSISQYSVVLSGPPVFFFCLLLLLFLLSLCCLGRVIAGDKLIMGCVCVSVCVYPSICLSLYVPTTATICSHL